MSSFILGAECSFYVKSIATYASWFFGYNNSVLVVVDLNAPESEFWPQYASPEEAEAEAGR